MIPSLQKPARGSGRLERRAKRTAVRSFEEAEKAKVRIRDKGRCRWPMCRHQRTGRFEVAHVIRAKGFGGDHGTVSHDHQMMNLCYFHHQGDPQDGHPEGSIERHNLKIEPLTDKGTNGPCRFLQEHRGRLEDSWIVVGVERSVGVIARGPRR